MEKNQDLKTVQSILKKCFVAMAQYEIISKDCRRITDNHLIKLGYNLNKWNDYTKAEQDNILNIEAEQEQKIKEKYGLEPTEAYSLMADLKKLFNKIALEYSFKYLATSKQVKQLEPLRNMDKSKEIIFRDRLFEVTSHLDIFLNGVTTEECLKSVE